MFKLRIMNGQTATFVRYIPHLEQLGILSLLNRQKLAVEKRDAVAVFNPWRIRYTVLLPER